MCRFIETIRIEKCKANNLFYHEQRVNETLNAVCSNTRAWKIEDILNRFDYNPDIVYKARIIYDINGVVFSEASPYSMKTVKSLRLVTDDEIDYSFKYENRDCIDRLMQYKGNCDNIIIVRNNLLTDTSYTNIALWNGSEWHTPKHPLLNGTMRRYLLSESRIIERDISTDDIRKYRQISMFNSMIDLGRIVVDVRNLL